jgi:phage tail-like protein
MVLSLQTQGLTALEGALGVRSDVSPAWKFYVEVLGVFVAEFQECSGLGMERELEEVTEGGTNDFIWLLPKHIKHSTIVLKKGITYNRELWRWFRWGQFDGQVWGFSTIPGASMAISLLKRLGIVVPMGTSVSIVLGTVDGKVAKHWDLIGAIPVKWTGPDMKADSNEAAIETLEIRHQGIDLSLEMMTPMAGFFGGGGSPDLSSPPPGEGAPNSYYDLQTGGPTETHDWHANDFVKITPTPPGDTPVPADKPTKEEGPNFWDMAPYGTDAPPKDEGSSFWDMPNLDPSQPPPKGQAPFAYFDFYDMTGDA